MRELGFDDALLDGAVLVEWPERAPEALPPEALHVRLSLGDGVRHGAADRTGALGEPAACLIAKCGDEGFPDRRPAGARRA